MDVSKIVTPPPITTRYQALEQTDSRIPGEIVVDSQGQLLKKFFELEGTVGSLVDQYDNFITNTLPEIVASRSLTIGDGEITFENVFLNPPYTKNISGRPKELLPNMCRDSDYSYLGDVYIELVLNAGTASEERIKDRFGKEKKTFLGRIPVMLGSSLDWLRGKTDREKEELGEGTGLNSGYFIIKGREKIVLIQEKLRPNRFLVFNSSSKGDVVVKITNNTVLGSAQISMVQGKKSKAFKMHLGFMGRRKGPTNKLGNTISVLQVFRMLGVSDPQEIMTYISLFTKPEYLRRIEVLLQPNFVKLSKIGDDFQYLSNKMGLGTLDYEIRKSNIMRDLIDQLFPQIPADEITKKLYMLSMMITRLAEVLIGVRDFDDRDDWGNKQLVTAGKSLELLFASIWREAITRAQNEIDTKKLNGLEAVSRVFENNFITDNFVDSFTANNWGVQSSFMTKDNITDILNRMSIPAMFSHLTKINTPSSRNGKAPKARMVQMSQLGYVDPSETPEGQHCGLVKNTSMTAYISLDRSETPVIEQIADYVSGSPSKAQPNPFILNGVFQGWVDGPYVRDLMIDFRRKLVLNKDTAIVLERDGYFNIYTDAARPTRPLLIVDPDGDLVISKKDLWGQDFMTLLREGAVEYVDAWEQDTIMLAQSYQDVEFRKQDMEMALAQVKQSQDQLAVATNPETRAKLETALSEARAVVETLASTRGYTHSEMDPTAILGMAVSIIPLPNTNPGPRLTYQAGMGKQSMGIYHSNHYSRFDTSAKLLAYPSRPIFETQMQEVLGMNELPTGETVIVAITTYGGFSQEDAIIMAKGAIDRGLFRNVVYKTTKAVAKKKNEKFARPEIDRGKESRYEAIGENGIPRLGSVIREGDCIIGKVRKNPETGKWENASSYMDLRQEGIVDRVLVTTNQEGERVVKVKIRQVRKPQLGDKYACYTPDHEVLTLNRSWIPISELSLEDLICTLDSGKIVHSYPTDIQSYDYTGQMYRVDHEEVDLCVTPNHRMYVSLDDEEYQIIKAEDIGNRPSKYKNMSGEYLAVGQWEEYQGKVYCCTVPSGIIYVRRNGKPVWCGNSRYAQKGTVGMILPDEDMPFTAAGVRPDIIINPHAIPSRMTMGKMIEIVTSKLAAFNGESINATAFRNFDTQGFMRNLRQYGYSSSGKERMTSGFTGKPLEAMIFTGPCYYQALKHQAMDKIQMRGRGGINQLTHQPVSGLKRGGGQRVGEMERDAIISHGASAFLRERLCLVSDPYETVYCSTCGTMAITAEDKMTCRRCDEKAVFGKCTIPYSFKLLMQLMQGAGISMKFKMQPKQ